MLEVESSSAVEEAAAPGTAVKLAVELKSDPMAEVALQSEVEAAIQ